MYFRNKDKLIFYCTNNLMDFKVAQRIRQYTCTMYSVYTYGCTKHLLLNYISPVTITVSSSLSYDFVLYFGRKDRS